jgi:tRNA pseudouridine32 synthase/23S rRNA pseudouridine746 synthase/23S rRNA pseudouridine1911/1915/1917 synthase
MKHKSHRLPFEILHEDNDMIVIDKPCGLLSTHTKLHGRFARENQPTAENFLNSYLRKGQAKSTKRVWLVHRLDRDTSGVMVFSKSEHFAEYLRNDWNALTEKTYLAWVEGTIQDEGGTFESYLADNPKTMKVSSVANPKLGKKATTVWKKIKTAKNKTLVEVSLKSGRKNQIRVHFSEAGHPIVGDEKYGAKKSSRLFLHSLELNLKLQKETKSFRALPPDEFGV